MYPRLQHRASVNRNRIFDYVPQNYLQGNDLDLYGSIDEHRSTVVNSGAKCPRFNSRWSKNFVSITAGYLCSLTCGAGAVDDKDFVVSFDQGNALIFVVLCSFCTPGDHGRTMLNAE